MTHTCHVDGCDLECEPRRLMCAPHWRMVPRDLQKAVCRHYRAGQEVTKKVSPEFVAAARAALIAVQDRIRDIRGAPQVRDFDLRAKPHQY